MQLADEIPSRLCGTFLLHHVPDLNEVSHTQGSAEEGDPVLGLADDDGVIEEWASDGDEGLRDEAEVEPSVLGLERSLMWDVGD